ncbi:MAG: hypothetical protein OEU54_14215 [Gemmatimonadota bacterium]|nr:hypothetical protein [Gemmatimonadota bacterium]
MVINQRFVRAVSRRATAAVFAAAAIAAVAPTSSLAQDRGNPNFYYVIHPTLWFANVDGVIEFEDAGLEIGDSELYASFAGSVEVGKGRWRGIGTIRTTNLAGSTEIDGPAIPPDFVGDYDFGLTVAELFASVEFGSFETNQALEFLAGFRAVWHNLDVAVEPGTQVARENWLEPVVGARYYAEMGRSFWATVDGNIGAFGIGSQVAWEIAATLAWRITRRIDFTLATRYNQSEYRNSDTGYLWDEGVIQGWHFGLRWKG